MGGIRKRARELTQELTSNPFFPLLFIGKATETTTFWSVGAEDPEVVGISYAMSVVSIILWLYTYEEVQWGICKAQETVEEASEAVGEATEAVTGEEE